MSTSGHGEEPVLSVIIPTFNRLNDLCQTLDHLYDSLPSDVEVIVVDDGSTDSTRNEIPRRYGKARFIRSELRQGPSSARNLGLRQARGRYVLPLDSDCFIVPETLGWLVETLRKEQKRHLLLSCRPWPDGKRSVKPTPAREYSFRDLLLKSYGEVVPILVTESLHRYGLEYPQLFAGGEPLLLVELSRRQTLYFVDKVILEYRTDASSRISSAEYQLKYPLEIASVFAAYLPYFEGQRDPELSKERARVVEKLGVYLLLGGAKRGAVAQLWRAFLLGRPTALVFCASALLPRESLRWLFSKYRSARSC